MHEKYKIFNKNELKCNKTQLCQKKHRNMPFSDENLFIKGVEHGKSKESYRPSSSRDGKEG